jgi:hypothetical protein
MNTADAEKRGTFRRPIGSACPTMDKSRISFSALEYFTGDYQGSPRTRSHNVGESVILLSYPATELSEESESRY